jgi:hypothetical protein
LAHRSQDIEEITVKDVLKDFQDNYIDVSQFENSRQISASREKSQEMKEVPQTDPGAGNGNQPSAIFKHSGQMNIFLHAIFSARTANYIIELNITNSHFFSSLWDYQRRLKYIKEFTLNSTKPIACGD